MSGNARGEREMQWEGESLEKSDLCGEGEVQGQRVLHRMKDLQSGKRGVLGGRELQNGN